MKTKILLLIIVLTISLATTPIISGNLFDEAEQPKIDTDTKSKSGTTLNPQIYEFGSNFKDSHNKKLVSDEALSLNGEDSEKFQLNSKDIGTDEHAGDNLEGHYWGDGVVINGTALDGRGAPFPGITVYLFIVEDLSQVTKAEGNANASTVTDGNGYYEFIRTYAKSEIGFYNYTVWYPNQDSGDPDFDISCFDCNMTVAADTYDVVDEIIISSTLDSLPNINPEDDIKFTMSAVMRDTTAVPGGVLSGMSYTYAITFPDSPGANIPETSVPFTSADTQTIESYGGASASNSNIIDFTVTSTANYYKINHNITETQLTFNITTDYTFTINQLEVADVQYALGTVNGSTGPTQYFYRNNDEVNITGSFYAPGVGSGNYSGIPINYNIFGAGLTTNISGSVNTDSTGNYSIIFFLDNTIFTDPGLGNVFVEIINTDPNELLIEANRKVQFQMKLKGIATTLDNVVYNRPLDINGHDNTHLYHFDDGFIFQITGRVLDEFGSPAVNVSIVLHLTNQQSTGEAITIVDQFTANAFGGTIDILPVGNFLTDESGNFNIFFTMPEFTLDQPRFTANITVENLGLSPSYRWEDPTNLNNSVFSFDFLKPGDIGLSDVSFDLYDTGGLNSSFTYNTFNLLNNTVFNSYLNPALDFYFEITIRDKYGRTPYNIFVSQVVDEANHTDVFESLSVNITSFNITELNDGIFRIHLSTITAMDTQGLFGDVGFVNYLYNFRIGEDEVMDISSTLYGMEIFQYGPDNNGVNPDSVNVQFVPSQPQESPHDIFVFWNLPLGVNEALFLQNLRYANISYRFSPEGFNSDTIGGFDWDSLPWISELMFYNNVLNRFEFTFLYDNFGNGVFFQIRIIIQDLSGFGLDETGATFGGGTWAAGTPDWNVGLAEPSYDNSVTNETIVLDTGQIPFLIKMGDTIIHNIDLSTDVRINGNSIENGFNITRLDQNITIDLYLPQDEAGYVNVSLFYRLLANQTNSGLLNFDNLVFDPNVGYTRIDMTLINVIGNTLQYQYQISATELFFGAYLDFYFYLEDVSGLNSTTTPFVSEAGLPQNTVGFSAVLDLEAPIETDNNLLDIRVNDGRGNTANIIVIYANESRSNYTFSYTVGDFNGTGLSYVAVTWFYYNLTDGSFNNSITVIYMQNGVIQLPSNATLIGVELTFDLIIPEEFFIENALVSFTIEVRDASQNRLTINPQDNNRDEFHIIPFPVPEPIDDGSDGTEEDSNRALWIVAGFIGVLALLTLYYQRNNIREIIDRRNRRKRVEGTLEELTDEIRRLGAEQKFRRAILLVWEALERISREILQAPRRYNQTAREFAYYLSTVTIVDRDTLLTLAQTFETARYGSDNPSRDDFEDAIKALEIAVKVIIDSGLRTRIAEDDEDW